MNTVKGSRIAAGVLLAVILVLVISQAFAVMSVSEGTDLSVYDEGDRGLSKAYSAVPEDHDKSVLLTSASLLAEDDDPREKLLVCIGPQRAYSLTEVHMIKKFINRGGRILVADDRGFMKRLGSELGVTLVDGQLYDENFEGTPDLVRVDDVRIGDFNGIVLLNRPTSLIFTEGQGFIRTSESSWVDRNGNGVMDNMSSAQGESPGPRFVGTVTDPEFADQGSGTAVFLSDPSLFMNWMIEEEGNLDLFKSLIDHLLPDGGEVIFDEGVKDTQGANLLLQKALRVPVMLTTDINMKIVVGTIAAISLFAIAYMHDPPGVRKHYSILDRTGVAEIVDPSIYKSDMAEIRKVLLDRVRISYGMSRDEFSSLPWDEIERMMDSDLLYGIARYGRVPENMDLTTVLVEVNDWERK